MHWVWTRHRASIGYVPVISKIQLDFGRNAKAIRDNSVQTGTVGGCKLTAVQLPTALANVL